MVKNVTLTVEEILLKKARAKALAQNKTLNLLFREWVAQYIGSCEGRAGKYEALMSKLSHAQAGRRFTRDEMNAR